MIFAVYKRDSDTCGNEDRTFLRYVEAPSQTVVEKRYPYGFFFGYLVEPVVASEVIELE